MLRGSRSLWSALWLVGALSVTGVAHAQPAGEVFQRGLSALQAGHNQEAADAFEAAYRLEPNPLCLLNLGIAYTNLGRLNNALDALDAYTRYADPARDAQTIQAVRAEIDRLQNTSGVIVAHVTPPSAAIQVDGQPVTPRNGELVVAPGNRRFVVYAQGYATYDQVLAVAAGRFTLEVALQLLPPAPAGIMPPMAAAPVAATQPPAPAATPPAQPPGKAPPPPEDEDRKCALGMVCLGPVLAVGLPNLIGGGLQLRIGDYFGASLSYQVLPTMHVSTASASASLLAIDGRIYPFGGAFFLAAGFGYQAIKASATQSGESVQASVGVPCFLAGLGFMGHNGLVLGIDFDFLIPLGSADVGFSDSTGSAGGMLGSTQLADLRSKAKKGVDAIIKAMPFIPQFNLLRLGYIF